MVTNNEMGSKELRAENVQRAVNGFALQKYMFKDINLVQKSNSWKETYFEEDATELTASGTRNIKGVSRGANFPHLEPNWTEKSVRHQKYAGEGVIYWEDVLTNSIDVMQRTLLRISRAIAKAVDDEIYAQWIAATGINTAAATNQWDHTTESLQKPIYDITRAIESILEYNYTEIRSNGYLLVSPHDYASLINNSKVINNPSFKTADVVTNGKVGQICGLTVIESNSVPADEALVIAGKIASTWKTASPLKTVTIEDPQIKYTIRASEIGITQVINPKAIARITNTQE